MSTTYIPFTESQQQAAKRTDLAMFLQSRGEPVKRSGSEYEWVGHHITLRGNQWYDQYAQRGGTAVDFAREQYGLSYPEAVQMLLGADIAAVPIAERRQQERPAFVLPPAHDNMRRVYAYLIKQRCIDRDIVYHFARQGLLYEDARFHNAVFVGTDSGGRPRHVHKKSTSLIDSSFRANQAGSQAAFSFHHIGQSDTVYVFESPIDMLSFLTLYPQDWQRDSYVTLCSVADHALFHQLEQNERLRQVVLCLDNDAAGQQATVRIAAKLAERGYSDVSVLVPTFKDWNDDVCTRQQEREESECPEYQLSL